MLRKKPSVLLAFFFWETLRGKSQLTLTSHFSCQCWHGLVVCATGVSDVQFFHVFSQWLNYEHCITLLSKQTCIGWWWYNCVATNVLLEVFGHARCRPRSQDPTFQPNTIICWQGRKNHRIVPCRKTVSLPVLGVGWRKNPYVLHWWRFGLSSAFSFYWPTYLTPTSRSKALPEKCFRSKTLAEDTRYGIWWFSMLQVDMLKKIFWCCEGYPVIRLKHVMQHQWSLDCVAQVKALCGKQQACATALPRHLQFSIGKKIDEHQLCAWLSCG